MSLVNYLKLNKRAFILIFKISGIVFTTLLTLIFIIFGINSNRTILDGFFLLMICIGLGNYLGFSVSFLVLALNYSQVKSQIQLYTRIPTDIKNSLGLKLFIKPLTRKYEFVEMDIIGYDSNSFIFFSFDRNDKLVWITIQNIMNDIDNFNEKKQAIDLKYKKDSIFLTSIGLKKEIKWRQWKKLTEKDVKSQIIRLFEISKIEKLRIHKMYKNINWHDNQSCTINY